MSSGPAGVWIAAVETTTLPTLARDREAAGMQRLSAYADLLHERHQIVEEVFLHEDGREIA